MNWLSICGKQDLALENEIQKLTELSLQKNNFSPQSLTYLKKLNRSISLSGCLEPQSDILIEKLRSLCKFWDVDPTLGEVSSHRKYIGFVIVKAKRALFSVLKVMLKPTLEKQRNFNAQVIEFLAEIAKNKNI